MANEPPLKPGGLAEHNLDANFKEQPALRQRFKLQQLSWGNKDHIAAMEPPYDVILCSDLLYDWSQHLRLAGTIKRLSHVGTCVLSATPDGTPSDQFYFCRGFYGSLRDGGFEFSELSLDGPKAKRARVSLDEGDFEGCDRGAISIVEMYKSDASLSD